MAPGQINQICLPMQQLCFLYITRDQVYVWRPLYWQNHTVPPHHLSLFIGLSGLDEILCPNQFCLQVLFFEEGFLARGVLGAVIAPAIGTRRSCEREHRAVRVIWEWAAETLCIQLTGNAWRNTCGERHNRESAWFLTSEKIDMCLKHAYHDCIFDIEGISLEECHGPPDILYHVKQHRHMIFSDKKKQSMGITQ